jgi:hypothetical protein
LHSNQIVTQCHCLCYCAFYCYIKHTPLGTGVAKDDIADQYRLNPRNRITTRFHRLQAFHINKYPGCVREPEHRSNPHEISLLSVSQQRQDAIDVAFAICSHAIVTSATGLI